MFKLLYLFKGHQPFFKMVNNCHRGLAKELQRTCNVKFYGPSFEDYNLSLNSVPKIIQKLYKKDFPDAIFHLYLNSGSIVYTDFNRITNIPKLCLRVDAQGRRLSKYFIQSKFTLLLNCISVNNLPVDITKKISHQIFPHSVDHTFFRDYKLERRFDVCFSGAVGKDYPLRRLMLQQLVKDQNQDIKTLIMSGRAPHADPTRIVLQNKINKINARVGVNFPKITQCVLGEQYSKLIAQSKILIFCNTIFKYPLNKMFEGMACKTLVMCDEPFNAKELGFVDGVTFVNINKNNFMTKIRYYLKHPKEMQKIVDNAYNLILKKHTHEIRAKQLLDFLKNKSPIIYK